MSELAFLLIGLFLGALAVHLYYKGQGEKVAMLLTTELPKMLDESEARGRILGHYEGIATCKENHPTPPSRRKRDVTSPGTAGLPDDDKGKKPLN